MKHSKRLIVFLGLFSSLLMGSLALGSSKRGLAYNENIPLEGSSTAHKQDSCEPGSPNGSTHLLAFNEPELSSQANLAPALAASLYRQYLEPFAGQVQLGAPAVSNDGWNWLNEFLGNCSDCTIDFLPIHWYNLWDLTSDLETWVNKTCALPGDRPVWVTEFGPDDAASLTADQQHTFLEQATNFLDRNPCVERYAYFGSADGDESLLANGVGPALSSLGKQYTYGVGVGGGQNNTHATGNGNNGTTIFPSRAEVRLGDDHAHAQARPYANHHQHHHQHHK